MKKTTTLLFLFIASITTANAQIPNSSFEAWTAATGYSTPDGWDNLNATTAIASTYTCEKGTSGAPHGSSFLMLTSKTVASLTAPGVAVAGKIDMANYKPKSGFPFTGRPVSLTGKWQYMASGADAGNVGVWLTKWDLANSKRDTIASLVHTLPGMVMAWASFNLPLTYKSGNTPDSAIIGLSSSGLTPVAGSYLYVDSLNFNGTAANVATTIYTKYHISMYPNPAKDKMTLDFGIPVTNDVHVVVMDIFGRTISKFEGYQGSQVYDVKLNQMSPGLYLVKVQVGEDVQTQRLVIQ